MKVVVSSLAYDTGDDLAQVTDYQLLMSGNDNDQ